MFQSMIFPLHAFTRTTRDLFNLLNALVDPFGSEVVIRVSILYEHDLLVIVPVIFIFWIFLMLVFHGLISMAFGKFVVFLGLGHLLGRGGDEFGHGVTPYDLV